MNFNVGTIRNFNVRSIKEQYNLNYYKRVNGYLLALLNESEIRNKQPIDEPLPIATGDDDDDEEAYQRALQDTEGRIDTLQQESWFDDFRNKWATLPKSKKQAWNERAAHFDSEYKGGSFTKLPKHLRGSSRAVSYFIRDELQQAQKQYYVMFAKELKKPVMRNNSNQLRKNSNLHFMLPQSTRIGKQACFTVKSSSLFRTILFGDHTEYKDKVFHKYEIVHQTGSNNDLHIHIMSTDRMNELMTIDNQTLSSFVCPKRAVVHQAAGKVELAKDNGMIDYGYIINEDAINMLVLVCGIKRQVHFPRPVWVDDDESGVAHCEFDDDYVEGYRITNVEPICIKHVATGALYNIRFVFNKLCQKHVEGESKGWKHKNCKNNTTIVQLCSTQ